VEILAETCRSDPWGASRVNGDQMQQGFFEHRKDADQLGMYRSAQAQCADGAVSTAEIYCLSMKYHWLGTAVLVMAR
jgi:hypothetical protein